MMLMISSPVVVTADKQHQRIIIQLFAKRGLLLVMGLLLISSHTIYNHATFIQRVNIYIHLRVFTLHEYKVLNL